MVDTRVVQHAQILVNHSCEVQRGDFVLLYGSDPALPLLRALASEIGKNGAHYVVSFNEDSVTRAFLTSADDQTIGTMPKQELDLIKSADVVIAVTSSSNVNELADIPPDKMGLYVKARAPVFSLIQTKRWSLTVHPSEALAQKAQKSLEGYSDFVRRHSARLAGNGA